MCRLVAQEGMTELKAHNREWARAGHQALHPLAGAQEQTQRLKQRVLLHDKATAL